MQLIPRILGVLATVLLGAAATPAFAYTFPLSDQTGLDSLKYRVYVMGFSVGSQLRLGSNGQLVSAANGDTVQSYLVGAGGLTSITIPDNQPFDGGRFYFFVVPITGTASANGPSVTFPTQPANPPGKPTGDSPAGTIYSIVEITVPAVTNPLTNATADVQTVDGFSLPLTITQNAQTNGFNKVGTQYGQPLNTTVTRASIFTAYQSFMAAEGGAGTPYLDMVYGTNSIADQAGGILNPYAYLVTQENGNYPNLNSSLNTIWNPDLTALFAKTFKMSAAASSGSTNNLPNIAPQTWSVKPVTGIQYPGTSGTISQLPALEFTGVSTTPAVPLVFHVFNPIGIAALTDDAGKAITGTITNANTSGSGNTSTTLLISSQVTALQVNMYVMGAGLSSTADANGNSYATTTVTAITTVPDPQNASKTLQQLTLSPALQGAPPLAGSQYQFCKVPYLAMFNTPGQMVFGNTGVFADGVIQYPNKSLQTDLDRSTVLGGIEGYLVCALNRGVALAPAAFATANTDASTFWGTQTNWYPATTTQNLFSLFMHQAEVATPTSSQTIFTLPPNASAWLNARSKLMSAAYGFAYDENAGPGQSVPVGQPEVPAKFDGTIAPGTALTITLGAWNSGSLPNPTPTPAPAPTVKIDGKKTIKTSASTVKVKGEAVGQELFVKYKKKPGKTVTKKVKVKGNGKWVFKFKPEIKTTTLQFYSEEDGQKSKKQKVKVIHE